MRKRITRAQNFIKNKKLIAELAANSSIADNEVVFEIGAGSGSITQELLKIAKQVVAYEIDPNLCKKLQERFASNDNFELVCGDFLQADLPKSGYKIFSNPPFNLTSAVIKKLLLSQNPPSESYIFMQLEAAKKFAGQPLDTKNSQLASIFAPQFQFEIFYKFNSDDFYPKPRVSIVLLHICKRNKYLVSNLEIEKYRDFVTFAYNQTKPSLFKGLAAAINKQELSNYFDKQKISTNCRPSSLNGDQWIHLFRFISKQIKDWGKIKGQLAKQIINETNLKKIYRTRVDPDWKSKKS